MSASRVKLLAAGLVLVCGLGVGGKLGLPTADAQQEPATKPAPQSPQDKIRLLELELERLKKETAELSTKSPLKVTPVKPDSPARVVQPKIAVTKPVAGLQLPASTSEYDFVRASEMTTDKFLGLLRDREAKGWEFKGEATLQHEGKTAAHWVFRKGGVKVHAVFGEKLTGAHDVTVGDPIAALKLVEDVAALKLVEDAAKARAAVAATEAMEYRRLDLRLAEAKRGDDLRALEAELAKLQARREELTKKPAPVDAVNTVNVKLKNTTAADVAAAIKVAVQANKNLKAGSLTVTAEVVTNTVVLAGAPEAVKWAQNLITALDSK